MFKRLSLAFFSFVFIYISSFELTYAVVFSREDLTEEERHVYSKVGDILRDRSAFNEGLVVHLEKYKDPSFTQGDRLNAFREAFGSYCPSPSNTAEFNLTYDRYIRGARQDKQFYDLLEKYLKEAPVNFFYTAVSVGLVNAENEANIGLLLDERSYLRKIKSLISPCVDSACLEVCEKLKKNQGLGPPVSIVHNPSKFLQKIQETLKTEGVRLKQNLNLIGTLDLGAKTEQLLKSFDKFQMTQKKIEENFLEYNTIQCARIYG